MAPPRTETHRVPWLSANGSRGSQHQIKAAFFHSWLKGQVGHCFHELWALKSVDVPPQRTVLAVKEGRERGEGMLVMPSLLLPKQQGEI